MRDDADELRLGALALSQPLVLSLELTAALLEAFRHAVEGRGQLAYLARPGRLQTRREVAACQARRSVGDALDGPSDRTGQVEAEAADQPGGQDQAGDGEHDRLVGAVLGRRGLLRGQHVLGPEELLEAAADVADPRVVFQRHVLRPHRRRKDAGQGDDVGGEVVQILVDLRCDVACHLPLARRLGKPLEARELPRQHLDRRLIRLQRALPPGEDVAAHARLEVEDELLELERRGRHGLRVTLAPGRVVERRDGVDEDAERRRDDDGEHGAARDHPRREGCASDAFPKPARISRRRHRSPAGRRSSCSARRDRTASPRTCRRPPPPLPRPNGPRR